MWALSSTWQSWARRIRLENDTLIGMETLRVVEADTLLGDAGATESGVIMAPT